MKQFNNGPQLLTLNYILLCGMGGNVLCNQKGKFSIQYLFPSFSVLYVNMV